MDAVINQFLSVLECVVPEDGAVYISIPITTGLRFLDWYKLEGRNIQSAEQYDELHYQEVVAKNIKAASGFIEHLRGIKAVVIEPTKLNVKGWTQSQYHDLWITVIHRFVSEAYFTAGWYLSKGCVLEYLTAKRKGIPAYDMNGHEISADEAHSLIESAIKEYSQLGLDTGFFSGIISNLENEILTK